MPSHRRRPKIETLEGRQMLAADLAAEPLAAGPVAAEHDGEWSVADSFSFGVEREMKESGDSADDPQAMTFVQLPSLGDMSIKSDGYSRAPVADVGPARADIVDAAFDEDANEPICYLKYKLDRCFIKSWSISGDADDRPTDELAAGETPTEEVAFYYNKIAFKYAMTKDGKEWRRDTAESPDDQPAHPNGVLVEVGPALY